MKINCNIDYLQEQKRGFVIVEFHSNQMHDVLLAFNALMLHRIKKLELISNKGTTIGIYSKQDEIWAHYEPMNNKYLLSANIIELILCFCVDAILETYKGVHLDLEFDDLDLSFSIE